jgi:putative addiction module killer protein
MVYRSASPGRSKGDRSLSSGWSAAIFGNVKGVGPGVFEYVLDFGPGYRIYFGKDGDQIIILLGGGTKKRQQKDINLAIDRWQDYKQRKKLGEK